MSTNNYILTSDGNFVSENELYHYGVLGMKWGVHRRKQSTDSSGFSRAVKRFDKKVKRGSLHAIRGVALENMGYKKAAARAYRKADYKKAKWSSKANRARKIKKVYDSYMKDLHKLSEQGRGNDADAVIKRSKIYDSQISDIQNTYKKRLRQQRKRSITKDSC